MSCFEISWILANVILLLLLLLLLFSSKLWCVCVFVAEFLALCPTGIGTTGDGRGNVIHKLKPLTTLKPSGAAYI